ncbi:hypothetical protein EVA_03729 [gut metagenome]|uniref:Uncharacterized protein n=1 Tax=gut metagenome TaxID=749906 RepID=J9H3E2_9ZZZZ
MPTRDQGRDNSPATQDNRNTSSHHGRNNHPHWLQQS